MTKYLKRVGATQVKFQMAVVLDRLELTIPVEGQMEVRWTRGPKTATSIAATGENGRFIWDLDGQKRSPLLQLVTMYMDKSQKFLPKKSKLVVKRKKPRGDGFKTVGYVDFDLSLYTDKDTPKETSVNFKLQNCGDKGALLYFTVHSRQQDQRIVGQQAEDEHSMAEGLEGEVDDDSVVDFTNPEQLYFAVPTTRPKPPSPTRPPKPQAPLPPPPHASPFPALNSSSREQDKHEAVEGPPEKRGEQDGGVVVVAKKSGEHDCVVVANFALLPASAALVEDARYGKPCCFSIQRDLSAKENQEDIEEDVCVFMTTSSSRRKDWLDCLARRGDMADWLIHRETVVEDVQKTGTSHVGEEKSVAVSHRWRRLWAVLSHGSSLSLHLRESSSPHLSPQISPSKTPHSTDQAIQTTTPSRKKKGLAAPPATTPSPSQQIHLQTGERGMGGAHQTDKGKGQDSGQREEDAPAQFHLAPAMSPKAGPGLNGIRSDKNGIRTVSGQKRGSTGMVNGSGSKLGKANTSQAAMGTAALQTGNLVQHAGEGEEEEEADEKAPVVFRPSPIADRGAPSKENEQADKATLVHKTGPTQTSSVQRTTVHTKHKLGELGQSVFGSSASAIVDKEGRKETRRKELGFAEFFGRGKGQGDAGGKKDNDLSAAHFEKVDTEERKGVVAMGGNVGKASKGGREDTADLLALAELADLAERAGREMRKEEEREAGVVHKGCGANGSELAGVKAFKSAVTMQLDKKAEPAAQRAGTSSLAEEIALERQRRQAAEEELEQFKKLCLQAVEELEQQNKHKETEVTTWKHRHDLVLLQVMQTKEQMNDLASSSARDRKANNRETERLRVENAKLRERNIKFDALQSEFRMPKNRNERIGVQELVERFTKQVAFYEDQLSFADLTLHDSIQAANTTNMLMMGEIQSLEKQLTEQKQLLAETLEISGVETTDASKLQQDLKRAIQARMKLSEAVNKLEVKLMQTNLELLNNAEALQRAELRNMELEAELATLRGTEPSAPDFRRPNALINGSNISPGRSVLHVPSPPHSPLNPL